MRQPNATLNNDNPDDFVEEAMIHNDSNNDYGITSSNSSSSRIFPVVVVQIFGTCKAWWVQCITIAICAVLTYSYNNIDAGNTPPPSSLSTTATITTTTNVQIAIMTIITLVGASPFRNTHLIAASIGTFVGGQNIIGSSRNSGLDEIEFHFKNYVWLLILATIVGLIWCFVITNSKLKILDGYAGRLGTTTFIGMNATMLVIFGPLGIIDWNRYYYGLYHIVHAAEAEDASSSSSSSLLASAWTWTEEVEVAIGYALAVLWLGCIAGATRIYHQRYVQKWIKDSTSLSLVSPPKLQQPEPLNNVLIPVLWALMSMLIVNSTNYRHAFGLYNGFAVGSYVAMASLQKIPTVTRFITVSFVAACWGLALTPFFVGFAGKSGFTSMCGHVTHALLEKLIKRIRIIRRQKKRQQQQQQQQDDKEQLQAHTNNRMLELVAEHPNSLPEQDPADGRHQQHPKTDFQLYHSHKPSKKKELILVTKQQRRQQQRLHHQNQQEHQNDVSSQEQEQGALLHHRAWSATTNVDRANDGDVWEHPLDS